MSYGGGGGYGGGHGGHGGGGGGGGYGGGYGGGGGGGGYGDSYGGGGGGGAYGGPARVYVGELPEDIRQDELTTVFRKYGRIMNVSVKPPRPGAHGRAFAFIEYDHPRAAEGPFVRGAARRSDARTTD